jgi:hypothetical protein
LYRIAIVVVLVSALSACVLPRDMVCRQGEQPAIQDMLYFGTARPEGVVSAEAWAGFVETTVTPRFPQGLTVFQASGQWRRVDGSLVREATHVLHLIHADDASSEQSVTEIMASYKSRFEQEAVLRVKARACVSF